MHAQGEAYPAEEPDQRTPGCLGKQALKTAQTTQQQVCNAQHLQSCAPRTHQQQTQPLAGEPQDSQTGVYDRQQTRSF